MIRDSQRRIGNIDKRRKSSVFNMEENEMVGDDPALARSSFIMSSVVNLLQSGKAKPKFENTFKLAPDQQPGKHLKEIEKIAESTLVNNLTGYKYEARTCKSLCCSLADEIKNRIKSSDFYPERYRVIVQVYILEVKNQDVRIASKRLALSQFDNHCEASFADHNVGAVAVIDLLYQE